MVTNLCSVDVEMVVRELCVRGKSREEPGGRSAVASVDPRIRIAGGVVVGARGLVEFDEIGWGSLPLLVVGAQSCGGCCVALCVCESGSGGGVGELRL